MVDVGTVMTILLAGLASLFMAWSIGAGSSGSTPFAPAVGANAISVLRAGFLVGILGLLGASLQGANVTETVGQDLIRGVAITPVAATVALLAAGSLVAIGVRLGYPIATAFTVTGAMIGVGLALGGAPAWSKYAEIATLWVVTPFLGGGMAYGIARYLRSPGSENHRVIALLGAVVGFLVVNIPFSILGTSGEQVSIAGAISKMIRLHQIFGIDGTVILVSAVGSIGIGLLLYRQLNIDLERAQRRFLLVLGALVAFSAGGSQVGLAIGPVLPLIAVLSIEIPLDMLLVGGGLGLLAGSWTGAPRLIKALSQDYSTLDPGRSIAALIPSFIVAQTAVFFGIPISFNEIIVSAILGSGYAGESGGVSRSKMIRTVVAWVGSFLLAFGTGFGGVALITSLI